MMAVMLCGLLTHRLFGQSFFDRQLLDRGVDLAKGREAIALGQQVIGPFASDDCITAAANTSGTALLQEMKSRGHTEAYIIDDTGKLLGKMTIYLVIECGDQEVSAFMDVHPLCLYADEPLDSAMIKVSQFVGESLPVIERKHRIMQGSIAEGALFQAVIDIQAQARTLERA
jgi:CIC family chloride channel protein